MIHLTPQQLSAYLDGALTESSTELVRRHLSSCADCTQRFARMEAQEEMLATLLTHEPGDAFFERFLASFAKEEPVGDAVQDRVPARAAKPSPARATEPKPTRAPEPGAVSPTLYGRREEDRLPAPARPRPSAVGWIAIAAIVGIVAAAATVVTRERGTPAPPVTNAPTPAPQAPAVAPTIDAPPVRVAPTPEDLLEASVRPRARAEGPGDDTSPNSIGATPARSPARTDAKTPRSSPPPDQITERRIEREPRNIVPVRRIVTETYVDSSGGTRVADPGVARTSPPADIVRSAAAAADARRELERARSASLAAASTKSAEAFESAAAAWERALPLLGALPEDQSLARRELAQARYQAWSAAPTPARRDAAVAAARSYLLYAPPGPDRDQAWTWLGRLKQ